VDFTELNAVLTGFRFPTQTPANEFNDRGLLKGYTYGKTDNNVPQGAVAVREGADLKILKSFLHKIGTRLQERRFKNINRVMLELDPDDSGKLDPAEMARFFGRYLNLDEKYSNSFFQLLDTNGDGNVNTKDLAKRLEPYLQTGFGAEAHEVAEWYEEDDRSNGNAATMKPSDARALDSARMPAGMRSNASNASLGSRRPSGCLPGMEDQGGARSPMSPGSPMSPQSGRNTPMRSSRDMAPAGHSSNHSNASSCGNRSPPSARGQQPGGYPNGNMRSGSPIPEDRPSPQSKRTSRRGPKMPEDPPVKVDMSELLLDNFRKLILKRGGAHGIHTLGRTFRIMDTNRNQTISAEELEIGLGRFGLRLKSPDVALLMQALDKNGTRSISYDEFMVAIRGQINNRRKKLIMMAFDVLDKTRDGRITADDVANTYDAKHHPDVAAGNMHPREALGDFLSQFDCLDHDNCITKAEFLEYYKNVSASIDEDDYFELMIRNAWHIAGGSGWCANTSNKRILVTFNDGTQKVVGLEHDMGQDLRNQAVVMKLLEQQGVRNVRSFKLSG